MTTMVSVFDVFIWGGNWVPTLICLGIVAFMTYLLLLPCPCQCRHDEEEDDVFPDALPEEELQEFFDRLDQAAESDFAEWKNDV